MMLPVLSSEYFVYHCMQKLAVVIDGRTTAKSLVSHLRLSTIYSDDSSAFACDGIQSTRTTAQVASFESSP